MTKVTLPKLNQTGANLWSSVQANDEANANVINGELDNENIRAGANIARSKLEGGAQGIAGQWYTPKVIVTEESRTNVAFGTMPTADEITGVVVPAGGVIRIGYLALWKSSVAEAGRAAVTLNGTPVATLQNANAEEKTVETAFRFLFSNSIANGAAGKILTTGSAGSSVSAIGLSFAEIGGLTAGTYALAVQFRATSGSVTAKERTLWIEVHGF